MTSRAHQPAEWAHHASVWTAWPHLADEWLSDLEPARAEVVAMCRALADVDPSTGMARGERIDLVVPTADEASVAREAFAGIPTHVHQISFGDIWLRDTGPIFVVNAEGAIAAARFAFNGWGGKYLFPGDDSVGDGIIAASGKPISRFPWVLEGGSVDVDGEGTCLTTRQCLLNPNRNPSMAQREIEHSLCEALGIERVLWLDEGLVNDHTDGHIDTLARFVAPGRVVCMEARDESDPNRSTLERLRRDLTGFEDARGRKLEVVTIPSPGLVHDASGRIMPASYANFIIGNRAVVVPTYGSRWDDEAVHGIQSLFPGRRTVGLSARALLTGGGSFHCITQQEPSAKDVHDR